MTPVFFAQTTESYVKTTESYEVCRLGHHMDSTFTGQDKTGLIIASDQTVLAVHNCNSLFVVTFQTVRFCFSILSHNLGSLSGHFR